MGLKTVATRYFVSAATLPSSSNIFRTTRGLYVSGYRIKDEKTLRSRAHQEAFQGWVYLLRRAVNLPLQDVATRGKVSPSRISKIQRAIETGKVPVTLRQLLLKCKVKNRPPPLLRSKGCDAGLQRNGVGKVAGWRNTVIASILFGLFTRSG
jgi:hypothetical protein